MRSGVSRTAGWRERVGLPQLGLRALDAKLDTGARTTALHASEIHAYEDAGRMQVRFKTTGSHDFRRAELHSMRAVRDSSGRVERRPVIVTRLSIGGRAWPIEVTLTSRATLSCALLLGRSALARRLVVDPDAKYLLSTKPLVHGAERAAASRRNQA